MYGLTIILLKEDVILVCADAATTINGNNTGNKVFKRLIISSINDII